ncbi:hypothetical protein GCM10020255_080840 [Rhodococcus baikonurensis]
MARGRRSSPYCPDHRSFGSDGPRHTTRGDLPADTSAPRPTLYLLNGAGGGEDSATWEGRTDVLDFFADKNVNVVTPLEGAFSYYTDWQKDDPVLGRNKWQTFLTANCRR